jgi:hypothetical protein
MAVVQDGAATAARAGKPERAAVVSISTVRTDLRWVNCAMEQAVRESPVGSARRPPTVEHHPVGDNVTAVARVVVRAVQATPHLGGELSLLLGITGRKVSPCRRGNQTGEADGFGIDRREQPRCAERRRLGARRDEDLGPAGPFAVNTGGRRNLNPDRTASARSLSGEVGRSTVRNPSAVAPATSSSSQRRQRVDLLIVNGANAVNGYKRPSRLVRIE